MSAPRQPTSQWLDPAFLRIMADTYAFQRAATMRQWETLLASPILPIIETQPPMLRVQEVIQINESVRIST